MPASLKREHELDRLYEDAGIARTPDVPRGTMTVAAGPGMSRVEAPLSAAPLRQDIVDELARLRRWNPREYQRYAATLPRPYRTAAEAGDDVVRPRLQPAAQTPALTPTTNGALTSTTAAPVLTPNAAAHFAAIREGRPRPSTMLTGAEVRQLQAAASQLWTPQRAMAYRQSVAEHIKAGKPGAGTLIEEGIRNGVKFDDYTMGLYRAGQLPKDPEEVKRDYAQWKEELDRETARISQNDKDERARKDAQTRLAGFGNFEMLGLPDDDPMLVKLKAYQRAGLDKIGFAPQALKEITDLIGLHSARIEQALGEQRRAVIAAEAAQAKEGRAAETQEKKEQRAEKRKTAEAKIQREIDAAKDERDQIKDEIKEVRDSMNKADTKDKAKYDDQLYGKVERDENGDPKRGAQRAAGGLIARAEEATKRLNDLRRKSGEVDFGEGAATGFDLSGLPGMTPPTTQPAAPPVAPAVAPPSSPQAAAPTSQPAGAAGAAGVGGQVEPGNIDVSKIAPVAMPDGAVATVRSISINEDGKEVLIPTVVNGKVVSNAEAIAEYRRTGRHLGKFDSAKAANAYAEALHQREAERVTAAPPTSRPAAAPTAPAAPKANTARSIAEDMQNDRVKKGGKWSLPVDRIVQLSPAEAKTFYKWSREFGPGRIAPIIFSNGTLQLGVIDTDGKRHSLPKKTELDKEPSDAIIRRVKEIANGDDAVAFDILQEMGY